MVAEESAVDYFLRNEPPQLVVAICVVIRCELSGVVPWILW